MKAILLVLKPEECTIFLNGNLSVLVRKKFPKDFIGPVFVYCAKRKGHYCYHAFESDACTMENVRFFPMTECNGKVIASFWCDKVGEIHFVAASLASKRIVDWNCDEIYAFEKYACLTQEDLDKYLGKVRHSPQGYAIHITNLKPFDKPKEISEFKHLVKYKNCANCPYNHENMDGDICSKCEELNSLTRAPSTYCYVEVE